MPCCLRSQKFPTSHFTLQLRHYRHHCRQCLVYYARVSIPPPKTIIPVHNPNAAKDAQPSGADRPAALCANPHAASSPPVDVVSAPVTTPSPVTVGCPPLGIPVSVCKTPLGAVAV